MHKHLLGVFHLKAGNENQFKNEGICLLDTFLTTEVPQ